MKQRENPLGKPRHNSFALRMAYALAVLLFIGPIQANSRPQNHTITSSKIRQSQHKNNSDTMEKLYINLTALKRNNWSEKELQNAELVVDLVQHLMNDHNFDYISKEFGGHAYVQHNQGIPDGVGHLIEFIEGFSKKFPDYTYDVKHIYVDGDFVIFHSHATTKKKHRGNDKKGFNIKDTWRIEDGKIVEHWDAIQPIDGFMRFYIWLTGGKVLNSNGLF